MSMLSQIALGLFISVVGFLSALMIFFSGSNVKHRVANYKIEDSGGDKHHGIIQIYNDKENLQEGTCTAFVVNKTLALTAAHCLSYTESDADYVEDNVVKKSLKDQKRLKALIYRLKKTCRRDNYSCMQQLRNAQGLLGEEIRSFKRMKKIPVDTLSIYNIHGEDTGIKGKAHYKHDRRDYGMISGDFSNFEIIPIIGQWDVMPGDVLSVCGFYGGTTPPQCTKFTVQTNHTFSISGQGMLVPGVSGGPVFNHRNEVVGIAEAAGVGYVLITPILGILNL